MSILLPHQTQIETESSSMDPSSSPTMEPSIDPFAFCNRVIANAQRCIYNVNCTNNFICNDRSMNSSGIVINEPLEDGDRCDPSCACYCLLGGSVSPTSQPSTEPSMDPSVSPTATPTIGPTKETYRLCNVIIEGATECHDNTDCTDGYRCNDRHYDAEEGEFEPLQDGDNCDDECKCYCLDVAYQNRIVYQLSVYLGFLLLWVSF